MKYFLQISYQGSAYRGWQTQAKVPSVQLTLRRCLSTILNIETSIMGCSRTDALVHARQYFAHFKYDGNLPENFIYKLNRFLPKDIVIIDCHEVKNEHHVQRDPIFKIYDYYIHTRKDPFLDKLSALYEQLPLDVDLMKEGASLLQGVNDFKSFCNSPKLYKTTVCNLMEVSLYQISPYQIKLSFKGNRFLKYMVRQMVGRLIDLGQSSLNMELFKSMIYEGHSYAYNKPAYGQGLYLSKVTYPYLDIPVKDNLAFQLK